MMSFRFPATVFVCAAAIFAAAAITAAAPRQGPTESGSPAALAVESLPAAERQALLVQAATERRFDRVRAGDVVEFLAREGRAAEATALALDTARAYPEKIGEIADALSGLLKGNWLGDPKTFAALRDGWSRIATPSRKRSAAAAYSLVNLELALDQVASHLDDTKKRLDGPALMRAFIRDYPGTPEASLAQFYVETEFTDSEDRAVEKFARKHRGTVGGAKALFEVAEEKSWGDRARQRLRETLKIVADLESGKYPPCEWVDRAPELVTNFDFDKGGVGKVSAEDLEFIVAAFKKFALEHLGRQSFKTLPHIESLLTDRLPDILRFQRPHDGDAMVRIFDELTRKAKSPDAVRYIRARYAVRDLGEPNAPDDAAALARSNRTLEELSLHADPPWREHALTTLASQLYAHRDYRAAAAAYKRYEQEYPQSDSAWVAAIAAGQAQAEFGDFEAARQTLRKAAKTYADRPIARIVGPAFAAKSSAALGDFRAEIADLKLALDAWDPVFGPSFLVDGPFYINPVGVPQPFADFALSWTPPSLRRDALLARVAGLSASLSTETGSAFETARWRVEQRDWDGALPMLERLAQDAASPFRAEAASLARTARLERALTWVDVKAARRDETAAAREFEKLAASAQDFTAAAARLARAAIAWQQAKPDEARQWMRDGMEAWRKTQQAIPAPLKGSLEEDVLAIRSAVLRQGPSLGPGGQQPYLLASSVTDVRLPDDRTEKVAVIHAPDSLPNTLFLTREQEAFLVELLYRFGATLEQFLEERDRTRPGTSGVKALSLFEEFFLVRLGRSVEWEFYAPTISLIDIDEEPRVRAEVSVSNGSLHACFLVEKRDGVWTFTRILSSAIE